MSISPHTDAYLPILREIETTLANAYASNPALTDNMVAFGLDAAKVAIKQTQGFAKNQRVSNEPAIQDIIAECTALAQRQLKPQGELSLSELLKCMDIVKRSVRQHSSHGVRGYFEFVKPFLGRRI